MIAAKTVERVKGRVSAVVASYNHAEFLDARMESLLGQTWDDLEIIVIDDCSTDNSVEVLRKYECKPKAKLIVRPSNAGWVDVSNQGFSMSTGEYLIFANCDDACAPDLVERLVRSLEMNPSAGMAFSRSLLIDEKGVPLGTDFEGREASFRRTCGVDTFISREVMRRWLLYACVIPNLSGALFRSQAFQEAGALTHDYKVCCDWDLFFRIAEAHDFAYVAEPLNYFREHGTTIRSSTKAKVILGEYLGLLFRMHARIKLGPFESLRLKSRIGTLWSTFLLPGRTGGAVSFRDSIGMVAGRDRLWWLHLALGTIARALELAGRLTRGLFRRAGK